MMFTIFYQKKIFICKIQINFYFYRILNKMRIKIGTDARKGKGEVVWESDRVVNGHMLLVGMSGAGKTYNLRKIIKQMSDSKKSGQKLRFHIFDVHGDIEIENSSTAFFSEQSNFGLNPLRVNPDRHNGGTRKRIQEFIATINKVMNSLGNKQEAVLRHLLQDVYAQFGFDQNDPNTWEVDPNAQIVASHDGVVLIKVPIPEKNDLKALVPQAIWRPEHIAWEIPLENYTGSVTRWPVKISGRTNPSIRDVLLYAKHILQKQFFGANTDSITKLEIANKKAIALQRKRKEFLKYNSTGQSEIEEKIQKELEKAQENAVLAYTQYVQAISTDTEFDTILKYDSKDVLKSVIERLENLDSIGIFKPNAPPFDDQCDVWRYQIKSLSLPEQKLFVLFKLQELFLNAVQKGEQTDITEVILLDEASRYTDDDPENPINIIAKEARKFGVALICAAQSNAGFTEDFTASVGTKIILGIDESFWKTAISKMRVDEKALEWIILRQRILVQIKTHGATKNEWLWIYL